nr:putative ORF1 [Marmot picobirnavirus]
MTQNQIAYWKLVEDRRANQARESETYRSNTAKEKENYRSNVAKESETRRHNLISEDIGFGANKASMAHAGAGYASANAALASVKEAERHNTAQEAITSQWNTSQVVYNWADLGRKVLIGNKGISENVVDGFNTAARIFTIAGA